MVREMEKQFEPLLDTNQAAALANPRENTPKNGSPRSSSRSSGWQAFRFIQHGLIDAGYTGRAGLHAFRHSLATVLIVEEKEDPKTAQALLRHAKSDVTMDVYTHAQEKAQRAAVERFESRMVQ